MTCRCVVFKTVPEDPSMLLTAYRDVLRECGGDLQRFDMLPYHETNRLCTVCLTCGDIRAEVVEEDDE